MMNLIKVLGVLSLATGLLYIGIRVLSLIFDNLAEQIAFLPKKMKMTLLIGTGVLLLIGPLLLSGQGYIFRIVILILLYIVLALSLNIVLGFAGQLSIGHAAFYGIGAYTTAILTVQYHWSFWTAFLMSALVAGLFGLLLGVPTLRLRGDYLAIVTIGFGEIVRLVMINWMSLTRGPAGIPGIPSPKIGPVSLSSNTAYYYLILLLAVGTVVVSYRLKYSRLGRGLLAVRDDEIAAEAMGVETANLKIMAFVLGACIAGMAGSFFASFTHYINPDHFTYLESVSILCMVVLGGVGSIPGVVLGACVLTILPEALRDVATYRYAIYGILLILMMSIRPQGMMHSKKRKGVELSHAERS